jgi:hypothetical protein
VPPYFLTGLDGLYLDGLYPDNLTGETLLKMVVSIAAVAKVTSKRVPQV